MIALIGSSGSMGLRYQAIFKMLGLEYIPLDVDRTPGEVIEIAAACDRILIASPTHTHVNYLRELLPFKKPILCEKPITKDVESLRELHDFCKRAGFSYQMVMQYKELPIGTGKESSYYDYFRHGADGLAWDCIQILALANGWVDLREASPIWSCVINGQRLSLADMDRAYIRMIRRWINNELNMGLDEILNAHLRVIEYKERHETD